MHILYGNILVKYVCIVVWPVYVVTEELKTIFQCRSFIVEYDLYSFVYFQLPFLCLGVFSYVLEVKREKKPVCNLYCFLFISFH